MSLTKHKVVVVGNGMVSLRFCERLLAYDQDGKFEITVLGEECRPAYDRVQLTSFFEKNSADELLLAGPEWYAENGIELFLGDRVVDIDRKHKTVVTAGGRQCSYDHLILATGSSPFVPPIKGTDRPGVFVYRTIEDLEAIRDYAQNAKTAAVIGGGLLGLEAAKAVYDMGLATTVVERSPRLLARQVDTGGGLILKHLIEDLGVNVLTNKVTVRFEGEEKVEGIIFEGDEFFQTDMIIISAGIRPNDELGRASGLTVGDRGGIQVDNRMRTSDHHIMAIGEAALFNDMIYGLVAPGYDMADVAAANLCHQKKTFDGADMSTKLKLMGVDVASVGEPLLPEEQSKAVAVFDSHRGIYKKLVLSLDGKKLEGAVLVGDTSEYGLLSQICKKGMELPEHPETLLVKAGDHNDVAIEYDDDEIICSCKNVTAGTIRSSIEEHGLSSFPALKDLTKVGTGCGGCAAVAKDIFEAELAKKGVEIDHSLCEHFKYSRQELFNIIKVTGAGTFDEILASHGRGTGCEICKPTVASILASIRNDYVAKHAQIQDTNDKYMGNIQRNGTYSVVPRVAGGELTPDQLIALGEVAKKYDLYTKVTGGQRVDLFGAHLSELPAIWKELIEAGFETGHAYGKSIRTVKSCVGSTWCRFGLQDSVGMAIRVENRYKGLRAPHKIKLAVSGCVRECAEAQSKDVGLIATEKGWKMYICGNGGVTPRHADLFASDIDDETAIKYIDRFLMYYVRTADKLTRTSTWIEKLEGGLKHVQNVVINDSLGINDQLEADMQHIVDTYKCEWAETLKDPEKLRMFRHYSNSEEDDPVRLIDVRGQKQPAPWKEYEPMTAEPVANTEKQWVCFGEASAVPTDGGATLKYGRHQIAVFNFSKLNKWFASQNLCPHKREMVLSRGLLGDVAGLPKVVCPMHKRAFSLETGEGLTDPELSITTFSVDIREGKIFIELPSEEELDRLHVCDPEKICS
ncbi:MAG TPA: nitrite reductase large subunit NirB [Pontiella sp.]